MPDEGIVLTSDGASVLASERPPVLEVCNLKIELKAFLRSVSRGVGFLPEVFLEAFQRSPSFAHSSKQLGRKNVGLAESGSIGLKCGAISASVSQVGIGSGSIHWIGDLPKQLGRKVAGLAEAGSIGLKCVAISGSMSRVDIGCI